MAAYENELKVEAGKALDLAASLSPEEGAAGSLHQEIAVLRTKLTQAKGDELQKYAEASKALKGKAEAEQSNRNSVVSREFAANLALLLAKPAKVGETAKLTPAIGLTAAFTLIAEKDGRTVWTTADAPTKPIIDGLNAAVGGMSGVAMILNPAEGKLQYYVGVGKGAAQAGHSAVSLVRGINELVEGRGGGKVDVAQGGTKMLASQEKIVAWFLSGQK